MMHMFRANVNGSRSQFSVIINVFVGLQSATVALCCVRFTAHKWVAYYSWYTWEWLVHLGLARYHVGWLCYAGTEGVLNSCIP